ARALELDGAAERAHGRGRPGLVDLHDHLARADKLGVKRLVEVEDGLQTTVVFAREGLPRGAGASAKDLLYLRVGLGPGRFELAFDQILAADAATPRLPELRLERPERAPAIGALVWPIADQRAGEREIAAMRDGP